jgi:hypothetical protein
VVVDDNDWSGVEGEEVVRFGRLWEWERKRKREVGRVVISVYYAYACGMNALVPTGTSAFNDPAAFVTTTSSVSTEEVGKIG